MKLRQIAFLNRSRAVVMISGLAAATFLAGCALTTPPTGPIPAIIYGVLYGQVTAPAGRNHISVEGRVYSDSADALAFGTTTGVLAPFNITDTSSTGNYNAQFQSAVTQVIYLTVFAEGQTSQGLVFSTDTAYAVRMRVDSLGGALGHDSIAVNLVLP
jgi:hypothetical protein